jgi:hypothetical protein
MVLFTTRSGREEELWAVVDRGGGRREVVERGDGGGHGGEQPESD